MINPDVPLTVRLTTTLHVEYPDTPEDNTAHVVDSVDFTESVLEAIKAHLFEPDDIDALLEFVDE
jgi:hypothetical protein